MIRSRRLLLCLLILLLPQPACFWRLWTKPKPVEARTFDVYGTVKSIDLQQIVIKDKRGADQTFAITPASIKGSNFAPGTQVHVYYKKKGQVNEVTMVVEKVK